MERCSYCSNLIDRKHFSVLLNYCKFCGVRLSQYKPQRVISQFPTQKKLQVVYATKALVQAERILIEAMMKDAS